MEQAGAPGQEPIGPFRYHEASGTPVRRGPLGLIHPTRRIPSMSMLGQRVEIFEIFLKGYNFTGPLTALLCLHQMSFYSRNFFFPPFSARLIINKRKD